ncbi:hypothetical protein L249_1823 [Ophiocordyceps polyrhachis-furcata BCC 54312]|uniref:Uncharacterized protein n=1 Tax=Ophiocordyceps polyrhachis-furcata BCC 54312 TaxID=1330021 RepID=A0A367LRG2_9HYPO|nr:hypothetical protein L249_1823 [Ophiocordyceps polyrhachis-furcata BCC 54312]
MTHLLLPYGVVPSLTGSVTVKSIVQSASGLFPRSSILRAVSPIVKSEPTYRVTCLDIPTLGLGSRLSWGAGPGPAQLFSPGSGRPLHITIRDIITTTIPSSSGLWDPGHPLPIMALMLPADDMSLKSL